MVNDWASYNDSPLPKPVEEEKDIYAGMFNNKSRTFPGGRSTEGMEPIDGATICSMCASRKNRPAED